MKITNAMIDAAARADAAHSDRRFDGMSTAEKHRFIDRASLMLNAAMSHSYVDGRIIELEAALRVVSKNIEDTAHEDMPGKDAMQDFITKVLERGE